MPHGGSRSLRSRLAFEFREDKDELQHGAAHRRRRVKILVDGHELNPSLFQRLPQIVKIAE